MRSWIFVTYQVPGLHCYPGAPKEVAYLKDPHRHVFHVKVSIQVEGDDRELEFIMVKRAVRYHFAAYAGFLGGIVDFGSKSCEQIAGALAAELSRRYDNRAMRIEISEDNENGAVLEA
jgi:hypothetical protein